METEAGEAKSAPDILIGLETHVQLTNLKSKLFCGCSADYRKDPPNTHTCPTCLGLPGALPVLNRRAVEDAVMVGLALNSKIQERTLFYRKNYFYPDMPKNYQISQYDKAGGVPISIGGLVNVRMNHERKRVRIRRLQLEEDPGKLVHLGSIDLSPYTLIDYNRSGVALLEIVSEPDVSSPKEARNYLRELQSILEHLGVSDSRMEGSMRCDANISTAGGNRVEIKNISSFKQVEKALTFEVMRQKSLARRGQQVVMETRHWDEGRNVTISLRTKEAEEEYRYFPEPNLPPVRLPEEYVEKIRGMMPELPERRMQRFVEQFGLPVYDSAVLTRSKYYADFFEEATQISRDPKKISNWMMTDLLKVLHELDMELEDVKMTPGQLVEMISLIDDGTISGKMAKNILPQIVETGESPRGVIERQKMRRIASEDLIQELVDKVFSENEKAVKDALDDEKAANYLVGQLMRLSRGQADPALANKVIRLRLEEVREQFR